MHKIFALYWCAENNWSDKFLVTKNNSFHKKFWNALLISCNTEFFSCRTNHEGLNAMTVGVKGGWLEIDDTGFQGLKIGWEWEKESAVTNSIVQRF